MSFSINVHRDALSGNTVVEIYEDNHLLHREWIPDEVVARLNLGFGDIFTMARKKYEELLQQRYLERIEVLKKLEEEHRQQQYAYPLGAKWVQFPQAVQPYIPYTTTTNIPYAQTITTSPYDVTLNRGTINAILSGIGSDDGALEEIRLIIDGFCGSIEIAEQESKQVLKTLERRGWRLVNVHEEHTDA